MDVDYSEKGREEFYERMAQQRREVEDMEIPEEQKRLVLNEIRTTIDMYEEGRKIRLKNIETLKGLVEADADYAQKVGELEESREREH